MNNIILNYSKFLLEEASASQEIDINLNIPDADALEAVSQDGLALKFVKNQTDEICLAAVNQDGLALKYVKNQTDEIRDAAVKQDETASKYIDKISDTAIKQDEPVVSNILYADVILNGYFHNVTDTPNEDTVYKITLTNATGTVGTFEIYQKAIPRVIHNPSFIEGSVFGGNPDSSNTIETLELGQTTKDESNKWRITKKLHSKFI